MSEEPECVCEDLAECLAGRECAEKNCPACVPAHLELLRAIEAAGVKRDPSQRGEGGG